MSSQPLQISISGTISSLPAISRASPRRSSGSIPPENNPGVAEFYRQNHAGQTVDFVLGKSAEYLTLAKGKKSIWEATEFLNTLVDDSDPDTDLSQIEHLLQTAEAIRTDGHPRWLVLTGFIHDLGKILCLFGEPQWAVVGDTFPVGCACSDKIVFPEFFAANPDRTCPSTRRECGIYERGLRAGQGAPVVGARRVPLPGVKDYLPEPALYMIRYHSFYPGHREGEYRHLMNDARRADVRVGEASSTRTTSTRRGSTGRISRRSSRIYEDLVAEYFPGRRSPGKRGTCLRPSPL